MPAQSRISILTLCYSLLAQPASVIEANQWKQTTMGMREDFRLPLPQRNSMTSNLYIYPFSFRMDSSSNCCFVQFLFGNLKPNSFLPSCRRRPLSSCPFLPAFSLSFFVLELPEMVVLSSLQKAISYSVPSVSHPAL